MKILLTVNFIAVYTMVNGHGRLTHPPSRSSMWRFGFDNPPNYDDASAFCGGFQTQWEKFNGKCGICGDSLADNPPRANEPGGKYANGIIVATYDVGQTIEVKTHLTANHLGNFEFRLCENNLTIEQYCFDKHLLEGVNGETKFLIPSGKMHLTHLVKLPAGLQCRNCVFQWRYNTGNSWGRDPQTGNDCLGCGSQETFQACADIAIGSDEIETGDTNIPVIVPDGDEDERENVKISDEFDASGRWSCMHVATQAMCHNLPTRHWSNRH